MGRHEPPQWLSPAAPGIAQEDQQGEDQHEERKTSNGHLKQGREHMTCGCVAVWWRRSAPVAPAMPEPRQRRGSKTLELVASAPCNQRVAAGQRPDSPSLSLMSTTVSSTRQTSAATGSCASASALNVCMLSAKSPLRSAAGPDGGMCARSIDADGNLVAPAASLLPHSFCGYMSVALGRPAIDACGNTVFKPTHDSHAAHPLFARESLRVHAAHPQIHAEQQPHRGIDLPPTPEVLGWTLQTASGLS
jgi:hypothetical protein